MNFLVHNILANNVGFYFMEIILGVGVKIMGLVEGVG